MLTPHPHQIEFINNIREAMRRHRIITAQLCTGGGKSVVASAMIAAATAKGNSCAFIVPRIDLLKQMSGTFDAFGVQHSFVAQNKPLNPYSKAHICSAGTLVNRMDKISPRVLFIDEAHISGGVADKIIGNYKNQGAWIIKLTATPKPERRSSPTASTTMVMGKPMSWLIANNYLADYRIFAPEAPELAEKPRGKEDYTKAQLEQYHTKNRNVIVGNSIDSYIKHASGKRAVLYAVSIKESKQTADMFNAAGIPAAHMDGDTPQHERAIIARDFALGNIMVICNVDLITTGYDLAMQCKMDVQIQCVILDRKTASIRLLLQMIGRGLRYQGGDKAVIIDGAGNIMTHGLPDEDRDWPLYADDAKKGGDKAPPVRQCPKCDHAHRPRPVCPECGHEYPIQYREVEREDGDLVELDKEILRQRAKQEQASARTLDDLIALGRRRGYRSPEKWASHIITARARR